LRLLRGWLCLLLLLLLLLLRRDKAQHKQPAE
jgi:hypothetical protein